MIVASHPPETRHESAVAGHWIIATSMCVGARHAAWKCICEDSADWQLHDAGALSICIADGVSGGACGATASRAAARHCTAWSASAGPGGGADFSSLLTHLAGLEHAVAAAVACATREPGAATLAAAWLGGDGQGWLLNVGDVRLYSWTAGEPLPRLQQLLPDQTFLRLGELPPRGVPSRNPARMVGSGMTLRFEPCGFSMQPGTGLMLCSDGIHDAVPPQKLAALLPRAHRLGAASLARSARRILQVARAGASPDDMSVLLAHRSKEWETPSEQLSLARAPARGPGQVRPGLRDGGIGKEAPW